MPPRARQMPIVTTSGPARAELAQQLWQQLRPDRWPLPRQALPTGTALVGGAVRDALLGRLASRPDLDFVVPADALGLCRQLAGELGGSCVPLDPERDIARLVLRGWTLDLARREGADLESDLRRRDYTANAIALPLAGGAPVDPTGGLTDLARGELVAVSEANLLADPLRLLRGVRLSCELELPLAGPSLHWIGSHAARLGDVAGERVLAELEKLAGLPAGQAGLQAAWTAGLLERWASPAAGLELAQLTPARAAECGFNNDETSLALPLARLARLLDGAALGRLRASRRLQQRCQQLRHWSAAVHDDHRGLGGLAEPQRLQLQRQLETDLPALLLSLPVAEARTALQRWRDPADPLFHPRPPLDGNQLQQALGLPPGRLLGQLLEHLSAERAFGRLRCNLDDGDGEAAVLQVARQWLERRRD